MNTSDKQVGARITSSSLAILWVAIIRRWSPDGTVVSWGKISEENSCHTGNLDVRWVKQFDLVLHDSCHHASLDSHHHALLDEVRRYDHVGSVVHLRVVSNIHSPLRCETRRMICDLKRDVADV